MGTQQKKKKKVTDTNAVVAEIKRTQTLEIVTQALQPAFEIGYSPLGINTIDFVNVSSSIVAGTQTGS